MEKEQDDEKNKDDASSVSSKSDKQDSPVWSKF